jgi:LmbE family N-acetylglucosaminyl deacetylase
MHPIKRAYASLMNRLRPELECRTFIRDWKTLSDIRIASGILSTESFRKNLRPLEDRLRSVQRMLILAPHQDDELIGAGGTTLHAKALGVQIGVLFLTDGGLDDEPLSAQPSEADLASIRRREAQEVCKRLGASFNELGINNGRMDVSLAHLHTLRSLLLDYQPHLILVPWLLDAAAKHRFASHLLWLAMPDRMRDAAEIWGYQVNNPIWANGYVDVTDNAGQKRELLQIYKSQLTRIRRYDHIANGLAAWNSRVLPSRADADRPRFVELFCALPASEHLQLVERFYLADLRRTYHAKPILGNNMVALHKALGRCRKNQVAL